jgi:hypothetical protein
MSHENTHPFHHRITIAILYTEYEGVEVGGKCEIKIEIASTWELMESIYVAECEYASVYDEEGSCQLVINPMWNCVKCECSDNEPFALFERNF